MPEFKTGCPERLAGGADHDHICYRGEGHAGVHVCFCGTQWDEEGRISIRKMPRRR